MEAARWAWRGGGRVGWQWRGAWAANGRAADKEAAVQARMRGGRMERQTYRCMYGCNKSAGRWCAISRAARVATWRACRTRCQHPLMRVPGNAWLGTCNERAAESMSGRPMRKRRAVRSMACGGKSPSKRCDQQSGAGPT